jgi:hypothetical protein
MSYDEEKEKKRKEAARIAYIKLQWEYPELKEKLGEIKKGEVGDDFIYMFHSLLAKFAAEKFGIPIPGVDILENYPYINSSGLLYKLQMDPRRVKAVRTELKQNPNSNGFNESGVVIFKAIVEFQDGSSYDGTGTACAKHLVPQYKKMSTMQPYVIELAETRSVNRAIRRAIAWGHVSAEEINERGYEIVRDGVITGMSGKKIGLIEKIEYRYKELGYNTAKQIELNNKFGSHDLRMLSEDKLKTILLLLEDIKPAKKAVKKKTVSRKPVKKSVKQIEDKTSEKKVVKKKATVKNKEKEKVDVREK